MCKNELCNRKGALRVTSTFFDFGTLAGVGGSVEGMTWRDRYRPEFGVGVCMYADGLVLREATRGM